MPALSIDVVESKLDTITEPAHLHSDVYYKNSASSVPFIISIYIRYGRVVTFFHPNGELSVRPLVDVRINELVPCTRLPSGTTIRINV